MQSTSSPSPETKRPRRLRDWLRWQQNLNPLRIDLGLDRPAEVAQRLGGSRLDCPLIVVAGTNGKGSCAVMLEQIYLAAGYRTGAFLSPALLKFAETVRVNGRAAGEAALVDAFERVDRARGDVPLTAFEFQTLAAGELFRASGLDVAIMEVGMGGRRDAVNVFDADAVLLTNVSVDHTDWFGGDRESIGLEKAGVMRQDCPVVYGDLEPARSVVDHAARVGAPLSTAGREFFVEADGPGWRWRAGTTEVGGLPPSGPRGAHWQRNAASVLMLAHLMLGRLPVEPAHLRSGIASGRLPGRQQHFARTSTLPERLLDVCHNPAAALALADRVKGLAAHRAGGRVYAVFSMLADKNIEAAVAPLAGLVDRWFVGGNPGRRGLRREALAARVRDGLAAAVSEAGRAAAGNPGGSVEAYRGVAPAYRAALAAAGSNDAIVVWGSFHTVRQVIRVEGSRPTPETRKHG